MEEGKRKIHWKSWDFLCHPKYVGGLGFRKMEIFNEALLTKQVWRFIQKPDLLVVRVLKARYFKHTKIMEPTLRHKPSYVWHSLRWSRELLAEGIRWRVGNGHTIRILKDKWLQKLNKPLAAFAFSPLGEAKVNEFIRNRQWDAEHIHINFPTRIANDILDTSIPSQPKWLPILEGWQQRPILS